MSDEDAARADVQQLDREIVRLALPALGALVAEPLFVLADSAIVAHLGTRPLAALGVAGAALTTLVAVFVFLAYGTTAIVSRRLGAGQREEGLRIGVDGLWLGAGLGVVIAAFAIPLAPVIATALGAPAAVVPDATHYLRIALLAAPAMLLTLAATGLLRGLQDTRTTLLVAGVGAIVNTVLNAVLVLGLHWGLTGSAVGTAVTQWLMAGAYLATLAPALRREDLGLRPRRSGIWRVAREGVPLLLRTLTLRAAIVLTTFVAGHLGTVALAAHTVAFAVWGLTALVLDAVAIAAQALVGRWLGAGDAVGARSVTRRMVVWGVVVGLGLAVIMLALLPVLPSWFGTDPSVQSTLRRALVVAALLQPLGGLVFVLDGVLIGAGDGPYLARAGVVTLVGYAPLALLVLPLGGGLVALWVAFGAFLGLRALTLVHRERTDAWLVLG